MFMEAFSCLKVTYMTWGKLELLYQENFFKPVVGYRNFRQRRIIKLLDSIVIGKDKYYSAADKGEI